MDFEHELEARICKRRVLGKRILDPAETLTAITDDNPELIFDYCKIKANRQAYFKDK